MILSWGNSQLCALGKRFATNPAAIRGFTKYFMRGIFWVFRVRTEQYLKKRHSSEISVIAPLLQHIHKAIILKTKEQTIYR